MFPYRQKYVLSQILSQGFVVKSRQNKIVHSAVILPKYGLKSVRISLCQTIKYVIISLQSNRFKWLFGGKDRKLKYNKQATMEIECSDNKSP